ncbi:hypothetical protein C8P64_0482 [Christiangramia gaetbulicola]|uniref:Uncharacterized protein n=2 Tax=Christiangramia TaxID=292691 RepID=A0A2T6AL02_9FLAO|nr:hypothetical protein C8P64_0482 [Christiangramia gaetbulicola]
MIEMYFTIKTINDIEGFVYSEEEFLKKFKNGYPFNDLRTAKYYAIYKDRCHNQEFEIIINSRTLLYEHLNSPIAICNGCNITQSTNDSIFNSSV